MARYPSVICAVFLFICVLSSFGAEKPALEELDKLVFKAEIPFAATNKYLGARVGYLPTNTVAFEKYAVKTMLGDIDFLNEAWGLGIAKPITIKDITACGAFPKINGFSGGITISNRYAFSFDNGKFERFYDLKFNMGLFIHSQQPNRPPLNRDQVWEANATLAAEWFDSGKTLSRKEALALARRTLKQAGCDEKKLKLQGPIMRQVSLNILGKPRKLPVWEVKWYYNNNKDRGPVRMEISGMTTNVVRYFNVFEKTFPMPDNYYDLLGLPDPRKKKE